MKRVVYRMWQAPWNSWKSYREWGPNDGLNSCSRPVAGTKAPNTGPWRMAWTEMVQFRGNCDRHTGLRLGDGQRTRTHSTKRNTQLHVLEFWPQSIGTDRRQCSRPCGSDSHNHTSRSRQPRVQHSAIPCWQLAIAPCSLPLHHARQRCPRITFTAATPCQRRPRAQVERAQRHAAHSVYRMPAAHRRLSNGAVDAGRVPHATIGRQHVAPRLLALQHQPPEAAVGGVYQQVPHDGPELHVLEQPQAGYAAHKRRYQQRAHLGARGRSTVSERRDTRAGWGMLRYLLLSSDIYERNAAIGGRDDDDSSP